MISYQNRIIQLNCHTIKENIKLFYKKHYLSDFQNIPLLGIFLYPGISSVSIKEVDTSRWGDSVGHKIRQVDELKVELFSISLELVIISSSSLLHRKNIMWTLYGMPGQASCGRTEDGKSYGISG